MPNGWRTIKSLVYTIRLHVDEGKEWLSAAGDGLTNIMENQTFVPRARYLRLLRRRRRYELLYHSVLRLYSEFRESRSFLWLDTKKSIRGKRSRIT